MKLPGVWKTLVDVVNPVKGSNNGYRMLWTGLGAQLARDVPFSAICWSILEPVSSNLSLKNTSIFTHCVFHPCPHDCFIVTLDPEKHSVGHG